MILVAHCCLPDVTSFSPPDVSFVYGKFPLLTVSFQLLVKLPVASKVLGKCPVADSKLPVAYGKLPEEKF